jgi:cation diffusion facilitator family transporter
MHLVHGAYLRRGRDCNDTASSGGGIDDACKPCNMASESRTAVVAALLGNLALTALKGVAAAFSGSAAMLAETFHSAADTGNQVLLFIGMRTSRKPADRAHPFGHGKNTYFWAFVVSMLLFSVGGAFSIWEGVRKFLHPAAREPSWWAYAVLGGAFVFEAASFAVALHSTRAAKGDRSLLMFLKRSRDPTLPTVLLEDAAALLSIVLATIGLGLADRTGNVLWDAAASVAIGLVLLTVAVFLALENHSLLIGEAAPADVVAAVRARLAADADVVSVLGVDTMHLGPESVLVAARVQFRDELRAREIVAVVRRLEDAAHEVLPGDTLRSMIVIEPGRAGDSDRLDAAA